MKIIAIIIGQSLFMDMVMLDGKKQVINSDSESVHLSCIASLENACDDVLSEKHLCFKMWILTIISWTGTVANKAPKCHSILNDTLYASHQNPNHHDLTSYVLKLAESITQNPLLLHQYLPLQLHHHSSPHHLLCPQLHGHGHHVHGHGHVHGHVHACCWDQGLWA